MRRTLILTMIAGACGSPLHAAEYQRVPPPRVRGVRDAEVLLLQTGATRSPTVRHMLDALEGSDLIVYVELQPFQPLAGKTTWLTTTQGYRYLLISLQPQHPLAAVVAALGHELQHALEIAAAPEVVDDVALMQLYRRIGFGSFASQEFETRAASDVGRRVRGEMTAIARTDRPSETPVAPSDDRLALARLKPCATRQQLQRFAGTADDPY